MVVCSNHTVSYTVSIIVVFDYFFEIKAINYSLCHHKGGFGIK